MNINVATQVNVGPALTLATVLDYAEQIAKVEGKDLFKHLAKMSTAAGDLAATADTDIQPDEHTYEEVAGLMLRAAIFGIAHGMTSADLMHAFGRETERLVRDGITARLNATMADAGFPLGETELLQPRH